MHEQSDLQIRRSQWKATIRRKGIDNYFQKRRYELMAQYCANNNKFDDSEKLILLKKLIEKFSSPYNLIEMIVQMDRSLGIFYGLTGFNPQSPPQIFKVHLENIVNCSVGANIMNGQFNVEHCWSKEEKQDLRNVWKRMVEWWQKQAKEFSNIIVIINKIRDINLIVQKEIINFIGFIVNILLMGEEIAVILGEDTSVPQLGGNDVKFMEYELQSGIYILHNILTAQDSLLQPFLYQYLQLNGRNVKLIGLYYNLFLIKSKDIEFRLKIMKEFIRLLENDCQNLLQNHKELIYTLYIALKTNPKFKAPLLNHYIVIGQRAIILLSGLLKVINMRFETFPAIGNSHEQQDNSFISNLVYIFDKYSQQPALNRSVMQQSSITLFMVNHLIYSNHPLHLKIVYQILNILSKASSDHYSTHFFIKEQPRLIFKVISLFDKFCAADFQILDEKLAVLNKLMFLISNLCSITQVSQMFIERIFLKKLKTIYFKLKDKQNKEIQFQIQHCYMNLLLFLKLYKDHYETDALLSYFFMDNQSLLMIQDLLRYTVQKKTLVMNTLCLLAFAISLSQQLISTTDVIENSFQFLTSKIELLQACSNQQVAERSEQLLILLKNRRRNYQEQF